MAKISEVLLHQSGRQVRERGAANIAQDKDFSIDDVRALGVGIAAMDASLIGPAATTGIIPAYMLQTWLAGTIRAITTPIDIDFVAGITTVGNWADDEIGVRTEEDFGIAELYGDTTNIPLAEQQPAGFEIRDVVRFEQGFQIGELESRRLGAAGFQQEQGKRRAANQSLDVARNLIGWNGLANTRTYGLLNDPNLNAVVGLNNSWKVAVTFDKLVSDFTAMRGALDTQMGVALRDDAQFLLLLPTGYRGVMNQYNTAGNLSFGQWLADNYPNVRTEYVASLVGAGGGTVDWAYLIAENVSSLDESDTDSSTIIQAVASRYEVIGSEKRAKGYTETASNALAGVIVLRPWAITRREISA